jgi:chromosome segregation ATPase
MTTAIGIGIAYATIRVKIANLEKNIDKVDDHYASKEHLIQLHKESVDEQKQLSDRIEKNRHVTDEIRKTLYETRENHSSRIVRIEEAMVSLKASIASIDAKLDKLLLR